MVCKGMGGADDSVRRLYRMAASQDPWRDVMVDKTVLADERQAQLVEALRDMLAGWVYIRKSHGDLYGVGWDRAQQKAEAALAVAQEADKAQPAPAVETDAARYRALRNSLQGMTHTLMPCVVDPFDSNVAYTPEGLDSAIDAILAERTKGTT